MTPIPPKTGVAAQVMPSGMALVAGYVDTVGFVALFGLFTAHVTGNFVLIGSTLAHSGGSVLLKLLAFPAFIAAVALTRLVVLALERRERAALRPMLILQLLLLCAFMALGIAATPIHHSTEAPLAIWAGLAGAAAMGVQNAVARLLLPQQTPTTVMTGNVTQLVIDLVDLLRGEQDPALRQRCIKFVWPIVAFAIGCIGGAFAYVNLGFAALALPIGVLALLAIRN